MNGALHKVGKADVMRVTESFGLPSRLHQQLRKLRDIHGRTNIAGGVVEELGGVDAPDLLNKRNSPGRAR